MLSHVEIQTIRDDPTRLEAMTVQQLRTMMRQVLTNIHVFTDHIFIQGLGYCNDIFILLALLVESFCACFLGIVMIFVCI